MPQPFIYINGWPGSGKHTTAKALEQRLSGKARVELYYPELVLDIMSCASNSEMSSSKLLPLLLKPSSICKRHIEVTGCQNLNTCRYIFTDSQTNDPVGRGVTSHFARAASDRGCAFIPVVLICEEEENLRRLRSQERLDLAQGGKGLLLDTDLLKGFRVQGEILKWPCKELLVIDVTHICVNEVVEKIIKHLERIKML